MQFDMLTLFGQDGMVTMIILHTSYVEIMRIQKNQKNLDFWKITKVKIIFFGVDFQKSKEKTILDPQNRDGKVDLRVFGEV